MKTLLVAAIASACLIPAANADTPRPAALSVRISDIDLKSDEGVRELANRFVRRMWSICGHPTQAALTYVNSGGGLEERAACKAELRVNPDAQDGVRKAFQIALQRFD